ncbi:hypothetical protein [Roseateles saccharophilus]|uniref:hypothetical protein n=1 Tax=Roseateles saccharophilus TaxID=304 RepID=UPI001A9EC53F|nr:hypothetical protein [Roseateles saccharophilus]
MAVRASAAAAQYVVIDLGKDIIRPPFEFARDLLPGIVAFYARMTAAGKRREAIHNTWPAAA